MEIREIDTSKPKIALLVDAWFPLYGGGQVHVAELAKLLATEHGYEVDILTRSLKGRGSSFEKELVESPNIRVKRFGLKTHFGNPVMRIWYMFATFFYLLWMRSSYQMVHAHAASSAIPMRAASWFTHVPSVVTVHGTTLFQKTWALKKFIERVVFLETRYAKEITVSENFLKAKNVNTHIPVIANGIDLQRFDAVDAQKDEQTFDVLFVGRLDYVKGLDVLLNAVKKVVESNEFIQSKKDFLLHIVGDGAERNSLEKLTAKLELGRYVKFHGKVTGNSLVKQYKNSDLFVLPSRSEGFPLSLLEACAARLPILATNVGDNKKLVVEGANGHLVAPEDVEELAYYLEHFALNPHLTQMGEAGYELVSKEYTWHRIVEQTVKVYEGVMRRENHESARPFSRLISLLKDRRMPWHAPRLLWERRQRAAEYKGKAPLKFCMTVDVEQAYGSADLPHEDEHIESFVERFTEMCSNLELPSTFFIQGDLMEAHADEFKALDEAGHELGIHGLHHELWGSRQWFIKDAWQSTPKRKKALRVIQDMIESREFRNIRAFRAPNMVIDDESLALIKEAKFEIDSSAASMLGEEPLPQVKDGLVRVPVSRDPQPQFQWRMGLPFGRYVVMNLANFLSLDDEELLAAVNRLKAFHRQHKVAPHLVFLCHSWEFQSRDHMDYASGENYTNLSKKLAMIKEHMDIEFMTMSDLCTDLYASS